MTVDELIDELKKQPRWLRVRGMHPDSWHPAEEIGSVVIENGEAVLSYAKRADGK